MAAAPAERAAAGTPPDAWATRRRPARRGEGAALREEIIEAATREMAQTGDAASITLRGIARAVGVAATSIYLHFDSVEALVDAVKAARFDQFNSLLRQAVDAAGPDPVDRLRARAHAYLRFWQEHPGEYAVMFETRLHLKTPTAPRLPQGIAALDDLVADVAAARGEPVTADRSPSAQTQMCAIHLWTGMHGTLALRMIRPHLSWPDLTEEIDDLIDRLLAPGPMASGADGARS